MINSCVYIPTNTIPDSSLLEALLEINGPLESDSSSFCVIGKDKEINVGSGKDYSCSIINSRHWSGKDKEMVRFLGDGLNINDIVAVKNSYSRKNDFIFEEDCNIIGIYDKESHYKKLIDLYTNSFNRNIKISIENLDHQDISSGIIIDLWKEKIYVISHDEYFYFSYVRGYGFIISSSEKQLYNIISSIKGREINTDVSHFDNDFYVKRTNAGIIYEIDPKTRNINTIKFYPEDKKVNSKYLNSFHVIFTGSIDSVANSAVLIASNSKPSHWYVESENTDDLPLKKMIPEESDVHSIVSSKGNMIACLYNTIDDLDFIHNSSENYEYCNIILPDINSEVMTVSLNEQLAAYSHKGSKIRISNPCYHLTELEKKILITHIVDKNIITLPEEYNYVKCSEEEKKKADIMRIVSKLILSPINIRVLMSKL